MKRSKNGTGHIRLRADGRYEGQYYYQGKRKSCYADSEEACRGKLNTMLSKIYLGTYTNWSIIPLYVYLDHWHRNYIQVRPSTHKNYETYIEGHIAPSRLGSIPLKKLTLDDFTNFFKSKEAGGRLDGKPGGLSPKTLRNIRNMLTEALDTAVNQPLNYIDNNPMRAVRTPRVIRKRIESYSLDAQSRLQAAALSHQDCNALMVLIDLFSGLRIGELCGLRWSDFCSDYFEVNRIIERLYIKWAENHHEYCRLDLPTTVRNPKTALYIGEPKTEAGKRKLYFNDQTFQCFDRIKKWQRSSGLFKPDGFVFLRHRNCIYRGYPFEPAGYYSLYREVVQLAGVDYINFHSLRHTFATRAYEMHIDIRTLSEIMGHSGPNTTLGMYGSSTDDSKRNAMRQIGSIHPSYI